MTITISISGFQKTVKLSFEDIQAYTNDVHIHTIIFVSKSHATWIEKIVE